MALEQQRAEGERLGHGPVDALAGLQHLLAVVEEALDRAVEVEALRHRGERLADLLQGLDRDAGLAAARIVLILAHGLEARPASVEPVGLVGLVALDAMSNSASSFERQLDLHLLDLGLGDDALGDELLGVELERSTDATGSCGT